MKPTTSDVTQKIILENVDLVTNGVGTFTDQQIIQTLFEQGKLIVG